MTSYLRGIVTVSLLCFRLSISPSFALQKQTENTLLESIKHKNHLQKDLITYYVYIIYLEVLGNGHKIKVDVVVRNVYDRVGRNLLSLFTLLFAFIWLEVILLVLRSLKRSFLLQTMEHNFTVPLSLPPAKVSVHVL